VIVADGALASMLRLLVKSAIVMRDNLTELNSRQLARRWPVLLGGAALTRAYVEPDLAAQFDVLSEDFQLAPEQSANALIVHHPEAKYFSA
jgi:cobalamin-dependent methionine synthase I